MAGQYDLVLFDHNIRYTTCITIFKLANNLPVILYSVALKTKLEFNFLSVILRNTAGINIMKFTLICNYINNTHKINKLDENKI